MERTLITFVGVGDYIETLYRWHGIREQTAKYLPWSKRSKDVRQQELAILRQSKADFTT